MFSPGFEGRFVFGGFGLRGTCSLGPTRAATGGHYELGGTPVALSGTRPIGWPKGLAGGGRAGCGGRPEDSPSAESEGRCALVVAEKRRRVGSAAVRSQ